MYRWFCTLPWGSRVVWCLSCRLKGLCSDVVIVCCCGCCLAPMGVAPDACCLGMLLLQALLLLIPVLLLQQPPHMMTIPPKFTQPTFFFVHSQSSGPCVQFPLTPATRLHLVANTTPPPTGKHILFLNKNVSLIREY